MNVNLAALPLQQQQVLQHALRHRWKSAFFELIIARSLQLLGGTLEIEAPTPAGTHPDLTVTFRDGRITVEAISPEFDPEAATTTRNQTPLLKIIEAAAPAEWSVAVLELPSIRPDESRKEFKRIISALLANWPATATSEPIPLAYQMPQGAIRLALYPGRYAERAIIVEPGGSLIDATPERIQHALKKQRRQVRSAGMPTVLAVEASGMCSEIADFDLALFGGQCAVLNTQHQVVDQYFLPNGTFTTSTSDVPTYAGVLAFVKVGFQSSADPVLYLHPNFAGTCHVRCLASSGVNIRQQSVCRLRRRQ